MKIKESDIQLPVTVAGLKFRNPFYVGSGPTTMTIKQLKRIEETGWGGASLKLTIDPAPYINRHPRYGYWKKSGILSFTAERRLVFEDGLRLMEQGRKETKDIILFSNITYSGDKGVEGWVNMAKKFEDAGAHANELNMCCPNMSYNVELSDGGTSGPKTGASLGQQENAIKAIVKAIKEETNIPLFVKLTPEGGRIGTVAKYCYEAGADVVGGTANRLAIHNMDLDNPGMSPIMLQDEISMHCMCSEWVHPLGMRDIYEIRKINGTNVIISGSGGIKDWQSAAEALLCGADILCVCAETLISGYGFLAETIKDLKTWMQKHNYKSTQELRNVIPPKITTAPNVTIYAGNARLKNPTLSAPCVDACPAHIPAQAYISKIAQGEFREAFEIIASAAPLQSICGYICNHPCEQQCTRIHKDEPVRIRELKRFVLEKAFEKGWKLKQAIAEKNGKRIAVVGSGPSGLTAAYELSKAGYGVTIFESKDKPGGMLRYAIPLFRQPLSILDHEIQILKDLGVEFRFNQTLGKNLVLKDLQDNYDSVYLALGAQKGYVMGIKGEKAKGCMTALDYLKMVAIKVKVSPGKRVAVIGGGFTAVDSARTALRQGAEEVYILYRRTKDEMPATQEEVREAEEEGIKVMYLVTPTEIVTKRGSVNSIKMKNCVLGEPDKSNRRRPEHVKSASYFTLKVDTVISAVSQGVELPVGEKIPATKWGTIKVDENGWTGIKGLYSGGDAALGAATVIEAVATARQAAYAMDRALSNGKSIISPLEKTIRVDVDAVLSRNGEDRRRWRVPLEKIKPEKRNKNFKIYTPALTDKQAVEEASRCYRCGCGTGCQICHDICKMFAWDLNKTRVSIREEDCVACGMCVWRCPNNNIEMVKTSDTPI
ncbi:MAG: FAD-dependent oxidoreductase [bacterium]